MLNNYIIQTLKKIFPKNLNTILLTYHPTLIMRYSSLLYFAPLVSVLKFSSVLRINTLVELTAYDIPTRAQRFTYNLFLLSIEYNYRLAINLNVFQSDFLISLSPIFPNSNWSEREVRDMFGIFFMNNPDLRRLLTDYGFEGFPLRKDFPLTGYFEVRYEDEIQQILYEPVQLSQEFRIFSLSNPWEKKLINI